MATRALARLAVVAGLTAALTGLLATTAEAGDFIISVHTDKEIYTPGDAILITVMGENSSKNSTLVAVPQKMFIQVFGEHAPNPMGFFERVRPAGVLETPREIGPMSRGVIRAQYVEFTSSLVPDRYKVVVKGLVTIVGKQSKETPVEVEATTHIVVR